MSVLVNCPHCSTRVLPMPGQICPACRKNVDKPPEPESKREQEVKAAYRLAAEQVRSGVPVPKVAQALTERGVDARAASTVAIDLEKARVRALQEAGRKNIFFGLCWCAGGLAVTVFTYNMAAAGGGGRYVLAWGAILFGGMQFLRGILQSAAH